MKLKIKSFGKDGCGGGTSDEEERKKRKKKGLYNDPEGDYGAG